MLSATLICTDEACPEELEAWSDATELEALLCPSCGCVLEAVAFSEVEPIEIRPIRAAAPIVELRRAA